jgi:hypothetical protein
VAAEVDWDLAEEDRGAEEEARLGGRKAGARLVTWPHTNIPNTLVFVCTYSIQ